MAPPVTTDSTRLRKASERSTTQQSGSRAAGFLILALVAAIGCAVLVMRYLDEQEAVVDTLLAPVIVAAMDLPLGTALTAESTSVVAWPQDSLPEGSFDNTEELEGRMVVAAIFKGEPITRRRLAIEGAGTGLAAVLPPGHLAVSVRVDDVVGVAGFIHPGDSVDIIVTMKAASQSDDVSKFILHNIKVLAVGKQLDRQKGSKARRPVSVTVATLMVTPEQAEKLALAAARGKLLLALRSSLDQEVIQTRGIMPSTLLSGVQRRTYRPAAAKAPTVADETVEIMRGDSFEKRTFKGKR